MKSKFIIIAFIFLVTFACFGQTVYTPGEDGLFTVDWKDDLVAFLDTDIVEWEFYMWDNDVSHVIIDGALIDADLLYTATVQETQITIELPYRSHWGLAVRTKVTPDAGEIVYSDYLHSLMSYPGADPGPFYCTLILDSLTPPTALHVVSGE